MSFTVTAEPCPHCWDDSTLKQANHNSNVYKDDCAYCFECNQAPPYGIFVCLSCFQGFCLNHLAKHMSISPQHVLYSSVFQKPVKPSAAQAEVHDVNELGAVPPPEYHYSVVCGACRIQIEPPPASEQEIDSGWCGLAAPSFESIKNSISVGIRDEISNDPYRNAKRNCPHVLQLVQVAPPPTVSAAPPSSTSPCFMCAAHSNNWMCLGCGNVGCPRQEAGGNGHAMVHKLFSSHAVVMKLGTLTPAGADLYCYECDTEIVDPKLKEHVATFGLKMDQSVKTSKTLGEMMYDLSKQHDWNIVTEAGAKLVPKFGPGYTGIRNFGNTCYINSILQCLFEIPVFKERFLKNGHVTHQSECRDSNPQKCYDCQFEKVAYGLLSGDFSLPPNDPRVKPNNNSVTPRDFKKVIARNHPEFSSAVQQDAYEYLGYLIEEIRRRDQGSAFVSTHHLPDPTQCLMMNQIERRCCRACHGVSFEVTKQPVLSLALQVHPPPPSQQLSDPPKDSPPPKSTAALRESLAMFSAPSELDCRCGGCGASTTYDVTRRIENFPDVFVLHMRREYIDPTTFTVKKHDVLIQMDQRLELEYLRGSLQLGTGEHAMKSQAGSAANPSPSSSLGPRVEISEESLVMVMSMGIEHDLAEWGLKKTNNNVERAIDYIFSHPEGPAGEKAAEGDKPVTMSVPAASDAALLSNGPASYELFGMVTHLGAGAQTGHYVAHVKKQGGEWINFNDEHVGVSQSVPFEYGSLYFYRRTNA